MKTKSVLSLLLGLLLGLLIGAAVICTLLLTLCGGADGLQFLSKVNTVRSVIEKNYIGDTDLSSLADGAADGMVSAIGDRWSYYMTAEEYELYEERSSNSATGVGITVDTTDTADGFRIISVTAGSPAEEAGITAGSLLVSCAGVDVRGADIDTLRSLISAEDGDFLLELFDENGAAYTVTVHTATYYTSPVSYEMLSGNIGYVDIDNFESGAADDAIAAIETLTSQGAQSLLFDVRSDPGGRLTELIRLLDYLLPEGDLFISVGKDGSETVYTSDESCVALPMAVLINEDTYSAAEFFAAALREYGVAEIVGTASTGKARSQQTWVLQDGSAVHISTRAYLTPERVDLAEQGGLVPDLEIVQAETGDAQLEAAEALLLEETGADPISEPAA